MAKHPFTEDIESLIESMDTIPIDYSVPFAQEFSKLLSAQDGALWAPNTTDRSKLATRLHFAGWSRLELEQAGLKPKDVENFRRKHGLKMSRSGRPSNPSVPAGSKKDLFPSSYTVTHIVPHRLAQLEQDKQNIEQMIQATEATLVEMRAALEQVNDAIKAFKP